MITSTLPTLPGNPPFAVLGVVGGIGSGHAPSDAWDDARRQMEAQAEALDADAIIDIRFQVVPTGSLPNWQVLVSVAGTAITLPLMRP